MNPMPDVKPTGEAAFEAVIEAPAAGATDPAA